MHDCDVVYVGDPRKLLTHRSLNGHVGDTEPRHVLLRGIGHVSDQSESCKDRVFQAILRKHGSGAKQNSPEGDQGAEEFHLSEEDGKAGCGGECIRTVSWILYLHMC